MSKSLQFITNYTRNRDEIITKADEMYSGGRTCCLLYLYFGVKPTKFPMGGEKKSTKIIIMNMTPGQIRSVILNAFPPQCLRYRIVKTLNKCV